MVMSKQVYNEEAQYQNGSDRTESKYFYCHCATNLKFQRVEDSVDLKTSAGSCSCIYPCSHENNHMKKKQCHILDMLFFLRSSHYKDDKSL